MPDLAAGTLDDVVRHITSADFVPDLASATLVRDRAAGLLTSDPARAYELATALGAAVARSEASSDPLTRAVALRCQAEASLYSGRLDEARAKYEEATAAASVESGGLLGQILVGLIGLLGMIGETRAALALVPRARRLLQRAGDHVYLGKLYMNLGHAAYSEERYQDAYELHRRAAIVFERVGLRDATWVSLLVNQAVASTNLSRIGDARSLFQEAEARSRDLGLDRVTAQAQFNLAHLERLRGDYRTALSLLETAGLAFEGLEIRDMVAATERARAETYLELGMPAEATELADQAGQGFDREGMQLDAALCRVLEARGRLLGGKVQDALPLLDQAAAYFAQAGIRPRHARTLLHAAEAHLALGQFQEAIGLARRALRTLRGRGLDRFAAQARCLIAEAQLAAGRPEAAERELRSVRLHTTALRPGERSELWALEGRIALVQGRRAEAQRRFRRAIRYLEAQRRLIPGVELRARAFEQQVRVYHDLIDVLVTSASPRFDDVFSLMEAARARGFRDRATMVGTGLRNAIVERRARLSSLVRRQEEIEYNVPEGARNPQARALRREVQALEKEIAEKLRRADLSPAGAGPRRGAVRSADIMRLLRQDAALVEYFAVEDRLLALVLGRDRRKIRILPAAVSGLRTHVESIRFQMDTMAMIGATAAPNLAFARSSVERSLRALHDALIGPILDLLPDRGGRVHVVPHAFLHHVPFECLHDGADYIDNRWLVDRLPTAEILLTRRGRAGGRRPSAVIAGTLRNGPPFVAQEIETVAAHFPEGRTLLLKDPTTDALLENARHCDVLHISAHGVFRDDNPAFSRIATGDGALFIADILSTRLSADLVVLSACSTGQASAGRGDDLSGVAHAFLAAGARQLVAGHWRVHDEATRLLMERFYDEYVGAGDGDATRALAAAARKVRELWDHPFYWGSFGVHGS